MSYPSSGERVLTELDHARLRKLNAGQLPAQLLTVLDAADIVPSRAVDNDVVTLYSQVLALDTSGGQRHKLTLCYPDDAEPAEGFVSVLSPVGTALLGRRAGQRIEWRSPDGRTRAMTLERINFQPEASGDYLS